MDDQQLYVSSLGTVSSVGWDVETTAASIRAGLTNVGSVGSLETFDGDELSVPLKGCAVKGFSDGFLQTGLWVRFSLTCFRQLIRYGSLPDTDDPGFWSETGVFWVLPDMRSERFMIPASSFDTIVNNELTSVLVRQLGLANPSVTGCSVQGHAGIGEGILRAMQWMDSGQTRRVVVVSVDSCVDQLALIHYSSQGRLQTPQIHAGFLPGEAAAMIMLEDGSREGAKLGSCLYNVANEPAISSVLPDNMNNTAVQYGKQLGLAIRKVLLPFSESGQSFQGEIYVDLNGEAWRSAAWGITLNEVADIINFDLCHIITPAASVGEIGAAAGGISICLSTRAFAKGYASGKLSMICNLSENGAASVVLLTSVPQ